MATDKSYPQDRVQHRQDGSMSVPSGVIVNVESGGRLQYNDQDVIGPNNPAKKVVKIPLAAANTAGGCFAWKNPEGAAIFIDRVILDVTTVATAAGTVKVGTAANATTANNNLIDTLDVHTATGSFDNLGSPGVGGKPMQKLASGQFITGSQASGSLAGLVGNAYIHYHLA